MAGMITGILFFQIESFLVMMISTTTTVTSISDGGTVIPNPPEWVAYTIGYNIQFLWAYISPNPGNENLLQQTITTTAAVCFSYYRFSVRFLSWQVSIYSEGRI
jgi:hypothetical protein